MKRTLSGLLSGVLLAFNAYASFQSGADRVINLISPTINIGVEVFDLTTGKKLYSRNAGKSFIPASNMKLFSDAAALMVLGPDYRFKNQLSTNATQLAHGTLQGSLYLHLSGDPSFDHHRLAALFRGLKAWQIQHIQGNVIIDSSHAIVSPYPPGWSKTDFIYSYGAPVAPVMIDANRLMVTVNPAASPEQPAIIETNDASHSIVINNQVKTKAKGVLCGVAFILDQENHLTVRGCVNVGQWAVQQYMAIRNPLAYAQGMIKQQLKEANIELSGQVVLGKAPAGSLLIASEMSKPIAQLMADTLKPSDNLYADSLFLHAAEKLQGSPVNWAEAQPLLKKFIQQETGIDLTSAVFTDGSGLSRFDLLTPMQTVSLLRFLYERFPVSYEYIAALPVSGRDGTLQRRLKKPEQQDLVRAKTGSMTGISSLSGYLYTANAHTLAFAIFINRVPGSRVMVSGRAVIDALCSYFLQQKPGNNILAQVFAPKRRIKFQQSPTQAELERGKQAHWRQLEAVVKQAIRGQAVSVLYRGHELVLHDSQTDFRSVLQALRALQKKYSFAIAIASQNPPTVKANQLLWIQQMPPEKLQRVWTIREAIG